MFDKIFQPEIHDYIRSINNPRSFKPYSPLDDVDISGKRCENDLKLLFITTTITITFINVIIFNFIIIFIFTK